MFVIYKFKAEIERKIVITAEPMKRGEPLGAACKNRKNILLVNVNFIQFELRFPIGNNIIFTTHIHSF